MPENNERKMYPRSRILYKTDNTSGWRMATMGVEENVAKKYCEEQKAKGIWTDYKCYLSGRSIFESSPGFANCGASAYDIHLLTNLIYNSYEDKWYYPGEIMPLPKTKAKLSRDFHLDIIPGDLDDFPLWDKEDFETVEAAVRFRPCRDKYNILVEDLHIPRFLKKLKKYGYAELIVEEYTFCKLLAWKTDGNILLILQDYGGDDVKEALNILVPEHEFYAEFIKFDETIKYLVARLAKLRAEFNATGVFLHALRWVYDASDVKNPHEYTLFSWNTDCTHKLKEFGRKIKKECLSDKCLPFGHYEYWLDEKTERLCRKYRYKQKDFVRFVKSPDFHYEKDMTLRDVKKQLLDYGYEERITTKWQEKEIVIFASGEVVFKEDKTRVPELESIIRDVIREAHKKPTLPAGKLFELLKKVGIETGSYYDHPMNIKGL